MITYNIDVLIGKENTGPKPVIKCHDTGVDLRVNLKTERRVSKWRTTEEPYTIPDGATAVIKITKPDKHYVVKDGTCQGTSVFFEPHPQTFTAVGIASAEVNIFGKDGRRITSGTFYLDVTKECADDCAEDSQTYVSVMSEQIKAALDAAERAEAAADRAETAGGNGSGGGAVSVEKAFFDISNGVISMKAEYRGKGSNKYPASVGNGTEAALPEKLAIPDTVNGMTVKALAPGMFYGNTRVKEVTIPSSVTAIPEAFAMYATSLNTVNNTEGVTIIGSKALAATRIKRAFFPNLTELGTMAFASCGYLELVDIGKITEIPERAFADCAFLREVSGGEKVTSIGNRAFYHTRKLRDLPLLAHVTSVADYAFFYSRICTALPAGGSIGEKAFPTVDNTADFWTGVPFTPCQNRLTTKLSQANPAWKNDTVLTDTDAVTYNGGCFLFVVMHIHSAITGKYYSDPRDFAAELAADAELSKFLTTEHWAGEFENVSAMFEALGYRTEVHGIKDGDDLTTADYKALVDALAAGAYVYAQVGLYSRWAADDFDGGHAVAIYGINEHGEVCVLDSAIRHEGYRAEGFEPDADVYTYTMPYQNLVGASSNFVIVYPPNVEPTTEDSGDYIPTPTTAKVGQTIVVKSVDDTGKPTEWEAADMASGGNDRVPQLLATVELAEGEEVNIIEINTCDDGTTFADAGWRKVCVKYITQGNSDLTDYETLYVIVNNIHPANGYGKVKQSLYKTIREGLFTIEAQGCAVNFFYNSTSGYYTHVTLASTHDTIKAPDGVVCDKITSIRIYHNTQPMLYGTKIEIWGIE